MPPEPKWSQSQTCQPVLHRLCCRLQYRRVLSLRQLRPLNPLLRVQAPLVLIYSSHCPFLYFVMVTTFKCPEPRTHAAVLDCCVGKLRLKQNIMMRQDVWPNAIEEKFLLQLDCELTVKTGDY